MSGGELGIIGDIGATSTRLALVERGGAITRSRTFATNDYPNLGDAIDAYLTGEHLSERPTQAVLAVASPVTSDLVALTNHPWTFSIEALRERLGLRQVRVINDFVANALAIPHLDKDDLFQIGGDAPVANAPIGVIGPGTGLGVSGSITKDGDGIPIHGAGGHVTLAAANAREGAVLDLMRRRFDHVSAERALSGPGLVNLYNALCELSAEPAASFTAAQITSLQIGEENPRAREATAMFCSMLGTAAGNLALTLGAQGGIYIAGGIVPRLGAIFAQSDFRLRFESKGRFRDYLVSIPSYVIVRSSPAFLGAKQMLEQL